MKKIAICLLSALFIITVFTACGSTNAGGNNGSAPQSTPYTNGNGNTVPDPEDGYVNDDDGIMEPEDNTYVGDGTDNDAGITVTDPAGDSGNGSGAAGRNSSGGSSAGNGSMSGGSSMGAGSGTSGTGMAG